MKVEEQEEPLDFKKKKTRKEKPINGITTLEVLGSQRQFRPEVD